MVYNTELSFTELKNKITELINIINPEKFTSARWFQDKGEMIQGLKVKDYFVEEINEQLQIIPLIVKFYTETEEEFLYYLPVVLTKYKYENRDCLLEIINPQYKAYLYSAFTFKSYFALLETNSLIKTAREGVFAVKNILSPGISDVKQLTENTSNTLTVIKKSAVYKSYRKLHTGRSIDIEIAEKLQKHSGFQNIPQLYGYVSYKDCAGEEYSLGLQQEYFAESETLWQKLRKNLTADFKKITADEEKEAANNTYSYEKIMKKLGRITAELHLALGHIDGTVNPSKMRLIDWLTRQIGVINEIYKYGQEKGLDIYNDREREKLIDISGKMLSFNQKTGKYMRIHGDLHLEQILLANNRYIFLDFEGEPLKKIKERRKKYSPLYDIAGLIRSISYLFHLIIYDFQSQKFSPKNTELLSTANKWQEIFRENLVAAYVAEIKEKKKMGFLPDEKDLAQIMDLFILEKALYELKYEINNRPEWLHIPRAGIRHILYRYKYIQNYNN